MGVNDAIKGTSTKAVLPICSPAAAGGNKALRPASLKQERCAAGLVRSYWAQEGTTRVTCLVCTSD